MITAAEVAEFRKIKNHLTDAVLLAAVEAVNYYVDSLPNIDRDPVTNEWAGTTKYAALLLAARWYNRQYSLTAVTSFNESGSPEYVTKYDSDIARMLHIDGFEKPMVG